MIGYSCKNWLRRGCLVSTWLLLVAHALPPASAQESALDQSALTLVPEDAAFFQSSLNTRETFEQWRRGELVRRLRDVPFVQRLEAELKKQWEDPQGGLSKARTIAESPNAVNLIKLAVEMSSTEMFIYGGNDWCDTIEDLMKFQNEFSSAASQGEEAMMAYFKSLTPEDLADVRVPTTIIGFRIADEANAFELLDALEGILRLGLGNVDELRPLMSRLQRVDFKGGQRLAVSLDTSLIPEPEMDEREQELYDHMMTLLAGRQVSLSMGVNEHVLLIAIGEDADLVEHFGDNTTQLLDHEFLSVLREQTPEKLRSIGFASQRWRESQWEANFKGYFQNLTNQFSLALESEAEDIPDIEAWRTEIQADARWLDEKLQELAPAFGPVVSWSYAVEGGLEGITYDWSENLMLENAQPMTILQHLGSNPLAVTAVKQKNIHGIREMVEAILEKAPQHLRRFLALAEQDEADRAKALLVLERGWPLLEEAYSIYRERIIPSLEDGQTAFTMAAGWTISELPNLPPPPRELPLPEMALACTLQNRELFLSGCAELYDVFDSVAELVREVDPGSVPPNYTVPRPDEEALATGTRYFYSILSDQVPLEGFEPQVLVGDDLIVVGYSTRQVDEMLQAQAPAIDAPWWKESTAVAAVNYVNLTAMTQAVRPWAEFALLQLGKGLNTPLSEQPGPIPTGNDILQMWDTLTELGEITATTSIDERGATVSRWNWLGPR